MECSTGEVWRGDAHLGEERFIALLGEYDRLGGEERDQRGLRAAYQQQIADAHKAPHSAPSMSAWNAERERRRADCALIAERLKRTDERLKEIASRRQEILVELVSEGMPKDRWIGYAEHYVLVRRKLDDKPYGQAPGSGGEGVFGLEMRRVLREALDEAPEGQRVGEIEERSARIERKRAMGPLRRTAARAAAAGSYVTGGCVAVVVLLLRLVVKAGRRVAPYAAWAGIAAAGVGVVGGLGYGGYLLLFEHFPAVRSFVASVVFYMVVITLAYIIVRPLLR